MKYLLDTCTFLWLAANPRKLSDAAKAALDQPRSERLISKVSVWEIVLKHSAGKLPLPKRPREWVPEQIRFFDLAMIDLGASELYRSGELPPAHLDPSIV